VCGGRVFEVEAVKRQPSFFADPEGAVFDCVVDVCGGAAPSGDLTLWRELGGDLLR
jgi:hypothetical protein